MKELKATVILLVFLAALAASTLTAVLLAFGDRGPGRALEATVVVACLSDTGSLESYGTGWWVNDRHIVTAAHVVSDCTGAIAVVRGDWASPAVPIAVDTALDVAVLHVPEPPPWSHPALKLARGVEVGEKVWAVGYPIQVYMELRSVAEMSISPRASEGVVAWLSPDGRHAEVTAYTDKGNSGGPVVGKDDSVKGIIVYARPGAVSSSFYMLTAPALAAFLDDAGVEYNTEGPPAAAVLAGAGALGLIAALAMVARW